jgi:predicted RNA binding protein YcfA (HicA-like mRNA interferase family)
MPRLPAVGWRDAVRAFERAGWQHDRTRGSHYVLIRPGEPGLLSVPMNDPIKRGTLRRLIRDAGLTVDQFLQLL